MDVETMDSTLDPTTEHVQHILTLSRNARWSFPTSIGNPVGPGPEPSKWFDPLVKEQGSVARIVAYLMKKGDEDDAVEIAANSWRLWVKSRNPVGGGKFMSIALDRGNRKPSKVRALALYGAGLLAFRAGNLDESRQRNEAALKVAQIVNDAEALAFANLGLCRLAFEDRDYQRAYDLAMKAREYARGLDPALDQAPLHAQGQSARMMGKYDEAAVLLRQSVELNRRVGDRGMVSADSHNLGHVEKHLGNIAEAERDFEEAATFGSQTDPFDLAMVDLNKASVAFLRGDLDNSRRLLGSCERILKESGTHAFSDDQFEIDWLKKQLGSKKS
jgi:tetratricopeptide (TPR) repeat protein